MQTNKQRASYYNCNDGYIRRGKGGPVESMYHNLLLFTKVSAKPCQTTFPCCGSHPNELGYGLNSNMNSSQ